MPYSYFSQGFVFKRDFTFTRWIICQADKFTVSVSETYGLEDYRLYYGFGPMVQYDNTLQPFGEFNNGNVNLLLEKREEI